MPLSKVKIRWGYLIALLLMLISYTLIFFIIRKLARETEMVRQSYSVINNLESIKSEMTDAETGVRGYLITKEVPFLKPYHTGSANVMPLYSELRKLTGDNRKYKKKLDSLGQLLNKRLNSLSFSLSQFQRNGFVVNEDFTANRAINKATMDSIRLLIRELQNEEKLLMGERDSSVQGVFTSTKIITITSLIIALITIVYSVLIYNRENIAKERAVNAATSYSQQLEERVNELDRVNSELQELKSIEKFAATGRIARTMAHEVRNPLTNISLASEQIKEMMNLPENEEAGMLLDMIGRNVNRINQLVSDLLNSTRFAQLEYASVRIDEILDETLELASDRIELNRIRVDKYYSLDSCDVYVDKEKIKLAFLNIIVNAIEAMDKTQGILQIKSRKFGNKCLVEITDNGVGMDAETIQRLFEPYFTGKMKGNGLGLTNTQNIIFNHKGHINVRSKPGGGSTFIITLNLTEDEIPAAQA